MVPPMVSAIAIVMAAAIGAFDFDVVGGVSCGAGVGVLPMMAVLPGSSGGAGVLLVVGGFCSLLCVVSAGSALSCWSVDTCWSVHAWSSVLGSAVRAVVSLVSAGPSGLMSASFVLMSLVGSGVCSGSCDDVSGPDSGCGVGSGSGVVVSVEGVEPTMRVPCGPLGLLVGSGLLPPDWKKLVRALMVGRSLGLVARHAVTASVSGWGIPVRSGCWWAMRNMTASARPVP